MEEHWEVTIVGPLSLQRDNADKAPLHVGDEIFTKEGLRAWVSEITQPASLNRPGKLKATPYVS